jgi:hypothetical protein
VADHLYSWNKYNTFDYEAYFEDPSPTLKAKPCADIDGCMEKPAGQWYDKVDLPGLFAGDKSGLEMMSAPPTGDLKEMVDTRRHAFYAQLQAQLYSGEYKLEDSFRASLESASNHLVDVAAISHNIYRQALSGRGSYIASGQLVKNAPIPYTNPDGTLNHRAPGAQADAEKRQRCVSIKGISKFPFWKAFIEQGKKAARDIHKEVKARTDFEDIWQLYLMHGNVACDIKDASDSAKRSASTTGTPQTSEAVEEAETYWEEDKKPFVALKRYISSARTLSKDQAKRVLKKDEEVLGASSAAQGKLLEQQELQNKKLGFQAAPSKARFMEQCYLTHFMDTYARESYSTSYDSGRFQHVRAIDGETGTLISQLNRRSGFNVMSRVTPAQLALLQPRIQLFKVRYNGQEITESRFVFDTETTRQDIRTIFETGAGRGGGIGIKDVSYEFLGGDPESAQRVITVKLTLFVQDIDKFFKEVPTKGIASPLDLVVPSRGKESIFKNSENDWIIDPVSGVAHHKLNVVDHETFEIKAVLGWSPPVKSGSLIPRTLRSAIERNQLVTMLTLHDHSFEFNQDGSMTIAASYNGRIEGLLDDDPKTNIFAQTEDEKREEATAHGAKKSIERNVSKKTKMTAQSAESFLTNWITLNQRVPQPVGADLIEIVRKAFNRPSVTYVKHLSLRPTSHSSVGGTSILTRDRSDWNSLKRTIKVAQDQIIEKERHKIEAATERILQIRHKQHVALWKHLETNGLVHSTRVDKIQMDDYLKQNGGSMSSFDQNAAHVGATTIPHPRITLGLAAAASAAVTTAKSAVTKATNDRRHNTSKKESNDTRASIVGSDYEFSYIYFGDLIDAALASISNRGFRSNGKRFRIALGPMTFGQGSRKLTLNLADVPISLNLFMDFYTENVVKQGKVRWPIMRFIKKVATDLVFSALGGECYENPVTLAARSPTRLALDIISFPKDIMPNEPREDIGSLNLDKVNGNWSSSIKASSIYEYIVLHANFFTLSSRKGNKSEDARAGIYHLELGRDEGIVKEIQLSKENKPMLVSDRLARDGKINRIAHPYHADIKMVGNTFFRPGSRVFINPSMTSIGSATDKNSLVSKLGIGGYYVVHSVTGHLEAGRYETTLRAKWDANGFRTDKGASRKPTQTLNGASGAKATAIAAAADVDLNDTEGFLEQVGHFHAPVKNISPEDPSKQAAIRGANAAQPPQSPQARTEINIPKFKEYSIVLKGYEELEARPNESLKERQRKYLQDQHGVYSITRKSEGIEVEFMSSAGEGKVIYTAGGE